MTGKSEVEHLKTEVPKKKGAAKAAPLQPQQVAQEEVTATLALVTKALTGKDCASLESIKIEVKALKSSFNQVV